MKRILLLFTLLCLTSSVYANGGILSQSGDLTASDRFSTIDVSMFINEETSAISTNISGYIQTSDTDMLILYPVPDADATIEQGGANYPTTGHIARNDLPNNPCNLFNGYLTGGHGDGGPNPAEADDYSVLAPEAIFDYLAELDFRLSDDVQQTLDNYIADDLYFIALPISRENATEFDQTIGSYNVTYQGDINNVRIPIMLTMATTNRDSISRIHINVASTNTPYVPSNIDTIRITEDTFQFPNIFDRGRVLYPPDIVTGLGLQIARVTASASAPTVALSYAGVQETNNDGDFYITKWRASDQTFTEDIYLQPDPDFELFTEFDLSERNLIDLYNCTTEGAGAQYGITYDAIQADLPTGRTYIPSYDFTVAHPEGWVLSDVTVERPSTYILAPEPVTREETLTAYDAGEPTPPMIQISFAYESGSLFVDPEIPSFDVHQTPRTPIYVYNRFYGFHVELRLLTSEADYQENQALYDTIFDYARLYRHIISPTLPHTLALSSQGDFMHQHAIAYAHGWTPAMYEDNLDTIYFVETTTDNTITVTYANGYEWMEAGNPFQENSTLDEETWLDTTLATYNLLPEQRELLRDFGTGWTICQQDVPPLAFNDGTERGYYLFTSSRVRIAVLVDSPISDELLLEMLDSILFTTGCG